MISSFIQEGVISRAIENKHIAVCPIDLRQYAIGNYKHVDDRPAGGGDGMVIRADITQKALEEHKEKNSFIIHLSPTGQKFDHNIAKKLSQKQHLILLSGRYSGYDARVVNKYADMHLSIGDFVLSGGELPAMCIIDAVSRFIPKVLGNEQSATQDSFEDGLLEAPAYTKPLDFEGESIPDILLSGNHAKIKQYQRNEQIRLTAKQRPDLILKIWPTLTSDEKKLAQSINSYIKPTN